MKSPDVAVIIRTKDEADRLRLTLASMECQAEAELIVVDDGSSDHTSEVLAEASLRLPLQVIRNSSAKGRSAASNAGACRARSAVLLFLDGDTLAGPDLIAKHAALHEQSRAVIGRGETGHLRCTQVFRDPEHAIPWPHAAQKILHLPIDELEKMRVTRHQVRDRFDEIERRAQPGVYPGFGPRRLHELEMEALKTHPNCSVLWSAASGSNMSVLRESFLRAGGFNEVMNINEHRELAVRLARQGVSVRPVLGCRSYHLTHRRGWRDPLADFAWEAEFLRSHPIPAVALLIVFWASLSPASPIPQELRIHSLPDLEVAARGDGGLDYDVARRAIMASPLGGNFWPRRAPREPVNLEKPS